MIIYSNWNQGSPHDKESAGFCEDVTLKMGDSRFFRKSFVGGGFGAVARRNRNAASCFAAASMEIATPTCLKVHADTGLEFFLALAVSFRFHDRLKQLLHRDLSGR